MSPRVYFVQQARHELVLDHPNLRVSPAAWARRVANFDAKFPDPALDPTLARRSRSRRSDDDDDDEEPLALG